ncbi:MAG TPA: hypothetical protein PKB03_07380 [Baekduia sp.]|nr:hypothetical protein [Baekduia sp.]
MTHAQSSTVTNPWPGAVALAGDRVVWVDEYWTSRTGAEGVGYWGWSAIVGAEQSAQRLFLERSASPFGYGLWNIVPTVAGSASRIVVLTGRDDTDVTDLIFRCCREVRSGPPHGPLSLLIPDKRIGLGSKTPGPWISGDRVIAIERIGTDGGLPYRAVIRDASGAGGPQPIGPILGTSAGAPVPDGNEFMDARIAGDWAAVNVEGVVTVLNRVTGESVYTASGSATAESWDLQDDGTLAVVVRRGQEKPGYDLTIASAANPQQRVIAENVHRRGVRIADGRVAFRRASASGVGGQLLLAAVSGGPEQVMSEVPDVGEFDFDGRRIAFITVVKSCVYVGDVPAAATVPVVPARASCIESKLGRQPRTRWNDATRPLPFEPLCRAAQPTGCHGAITVRARTRQGRMLQLAETPFTAAAGRRATVNFTFTRAVLRRLRYSRDGRAALRVQALTTGWTGAGRDLKLPVWTDAGTSTSTASTTIHVKRQAR